MYVRANAIHVSREHSARKDVGREVAIRALRPAEGNRNIQAERHSP
jgi:hypothetical protein